MLALVSDLRKAGHSAGLVAAVLTQSQAAREGRGQVRPVRRPDAVHRGRARAGDAAARRRPPCRAIPRPPGSTASPTSAAASAATRMALAALDSRSPPSRPTRSPPPSPATTSPRSRTPPCEHGDAGGRRPARHRRRLPRPGPPHRRPRPDLAAHRPRRLLAVARLRLRARDGPLGRRQARPRPRPRPHPADAEAQWVSVDGQLVEMGLWFGALARPGIRRAALVIARRRAARAHRAGRQRRRRGRRARRRTSTSRTAPSSGPV